MLIFDVNGLKGKDTSKSYESLYVFLKIYSPTLGKLNCQQSLKKSKDSQRRQEPIRKLLVFETTKSDFSGYRRKVWKFNNEGIGRDRGRY